MLIHNKRTKAIVVAIFILVLGFTLAVPLMTIVLAAFSKVWNGTLPSSYTTQRIQDAITGDNLKSLSVTIQTALIASFCSILVATICAVLIHQNNAWNTFWGKLTVTSFYLPVTVPTVAIGLGLLLAGNQRPFLIGGTKWIVLLTHTLLVLFYSFTTIKTRLQQLDPDYHLVAKSLGSNSLNTLRTITLPLLFPAMKNAARLAIAFSIGELGATVMVYPETWRTIPVTVFTLSDRGQFYDAAAIVTICFIATIILLSLISSLKFKWENYS